MKAINRRRYRNRVLELVKVSRSGFYPKENLGEWER